MLYFLLSIPFILLGLVMFLMAVWLHRSVSKRRNQATAHADARIAEKLVQRTNIGMKNIPHFVYEFEVYGVRRQAEFAGKRYWQRDDIVSIFYDPEHPETIYIPEAQSWLAIIALYFVGGGWIFVGFMLLVFWSLGIS